MVSGFGAAVGFCVDLIMTVTDGTHPVEIDVTLDVR